MKVEYSLNMQVTEMNCSNLHFSIKLFCIYKVLVQTKFWYILEDERGRELGLPEECRTT